MSVFIIDASVAAKWYFLEQWHHDARQYLLPQHNLLAPDLLKIEFANILFKKENNHEIDAIRSDNLLQHFLQKSTIKYVSTEGLLSRAHEIAREISHPVYDCIYLALAEQENAEMVTADQKFYKRVKPSQFSSFLRWLEISPQSE